MQEKCGATVEIQTLITGTKRQKLIKYTKWFALNCTVQNQTTVILAILKSELGGYLFTSLSKKLITALVCLVAASTSVAVMPRVAAAAAVVVLVSAASFHFVFAETRVAVNAPL